jgi:SAM-dependent methyltransferase
LWQSCDEGNYCPLPRAAAQGIQEAQNALRAREISMTAFEAMYVRILPLLSPLNCAVRASLLGVARSCKNPPIRILDVGGRKSPYTAGLPGKIWITDLPRRTGLQEELCLGIDHAVIRHLQARRSNVKGIIFDDMTASSMPGSFFDCVVAVEVLEHVDHDFLFVREVHRVLKKGGIFLMTTPNGDWVPNTNPDHRRHYTRQQLADILSGYFPNVCVRYAIPGGVFHRWGLRSWSVRHPLNTVKSVLGNAVNVVQGSLAGVSGRMLGTQHLFAIAEKDTADLQPVLPAVTKTAELAAGRSPHLVSR